MLFGVRVRADEQLAVIGELTAAVPDLLSVEDELVPVGHGAESERGEVAAGPWFGKSLAPHVLRREHLGMSSDFCSWVPHAKMAGPISPMPNWFGCRGARARCISSSNTICSIADALRPPYSAGHATQAYRAS